VDPVLSMPREGVRSHVASATLTWYSTTHLEDRGEYTFSNPDGILDEEERVLQSELLVRKGLMQRRTHVLDHLEPVKHVEFGHTEEMGVGGVLGW
jgi:hypothetical protein